VKVIYIPDVFTLIDYFSVEYDLPINQCWHTEVQSWILHSLYKSFPNPVLLE